MAFESLIIKKGYSKNLQERLHQLEDLNRDLIGMIENSYDAEAKVIEKIEKNKSIKLATRFYNQRGEDVVQGSVTMLPPKRT